MLKCAMLGAFTVYKIGTYFLPIHLNMCFGCSKEPSHRDGSSEIPHHMFWLRNFLLINSCSAEPGFILF